jgi:hypothetical protein
MSAPAVEKIPRSAGLKPVSAKLTGRNGITLQNFQRYEFGRFFAPNCKHLSLKGHKRVNNEKGAVFKRHL